MRRLIAALMLIALLGASAGCTSVIAGGGTAAAGPAAASPAVEASAAPEPEPAPPKVVMPVFTYHHVKPSPDNFIAISPETFEAHLQIIAQQGYTPITASQLRAHLYEGAPLPDKPMMITFDDGWSNQIDHALPLLEKYGYRATFFIYPKVIKGGSFMTADDAASLVRAGHDVASHTWGHTGVTAEPGEDVSAFTARFAGDFQKTGAWFESTLGARPQMLAYPYGYHDITTLPVLDANGITVAFTTDEGLNILGETDPRLLKRFSIFRVDTVESFRERLVGQPLRVVDGLPQASSIVPGTQADISGRITAKVDPASVEVLFDSRVVPASVQQAADGTIMFSTGRPGDAGFHWVALRARDAAGQTYYEGWGFTQR